MAKETGPDALLLERYKIAYGEYRAEVALGNERQKLFVSLNPIIAALASSARIELASAALVLAACASCLAIGLVDLSHGRYKQTREVLQSLARELACEDDWQTTGGMRQTRGQPRWEGVRVTTRIKALLVLYVAFDIAVVALLWSPSLRKMLGLGSS